MGISWDNGDSITGIPWEYDGTIVIYWLNDGVIIKIRDLLLKLL